MDPGTQRRSACLFWILTLSSFVCTTIYLSMCTEEVSLSSQEPCAYIEGLTVTTVIAFLCGIFWYCYKQKMRYGTSLEYYLHPLPLFADGTEPETMSVPDGQPSMTERMLQSDMLKPLTVDTVPEDFECAICNDSEHSTNHKVTRLACNHVFHRECVLRWFLSTSKKTCPICRTSQVPEGRLLVITIIPQEGRTPVRLSQV